MKLLFTALLVSTAAQPSPRRRSPVPVWTDRRRYDPPIFDDRRRYVPTPPADDRRRTDDRRRSPPPLRCEVKHCLFCPVPIVCAQCEIGYRRSDGTGPAKVKIPGLECEPCAANCTRCETGGKEKCDSDGCEERFTFDKGLCYACSTNCQKCDSVGAGGCDPNKCDAGYGPRSPKGCGQCAQFCVTCSTVGAANCDEGKCVQRYTNDGQKCSPCSSSCYSCNTNGPHKCDQCLTGYFVDGNKECQKCAENCDACDDASPQGCQVCSLGYEFDREHKCVVESYFTNEGWIVGGTVAGVFLLCCSVFLCRRERLRDASLMSSRAVSLPPPLEPIWSIPSGSWRGYYTYEGRNHDVCQFHLRFDGSSVHGDGVDDVGSYNISGNYDARKHCISFVKQYRRGTRNQRGVLNEDNEGHAVTYTGRLVGQNLGAGFRGSWRIRNWGTNSDGVFHLWPAMETWASAPPQEVNAHVFQVAEDGECVVCMDQRISTCLRPCGHIALCSQCANQLKRTSGSCPICRTPIEFIMSNGPSAMQALQTSS